MIFKLIKQFCLVALCSRPCMNTNTWRAELVQLAEADIRLGIKSVVYLVDIPQEVMDD